MLPFDCEYRFNEYKHEYEKNQWYELPATIMPDGPKMPEAPSPLCLRVSVVRKRWIGSLEPQDAEVGS